MTHTRDSFVVPPSQTVGRQEAMPRSLGIVGAGRLGTALAAVFREARLAVEGPARRGEVPGGEAILLCVPDREIEAAAETVAGAAPLIGHTSGATPLAALAPARDAGAAVFALHPLQSVTADDGAQPRALFAGAGAAVAGSSPEALETARALAARAGMRPFVLADERRAAYHAAGSIASNFLVTLQTAAEQVAGAAGLAPEEARALLAPVVRRTLENHITRGPDAALTGPIARGDDGTVAAQRAAVGDACPELLPLFDALAERTRALAGRSRAVSERRAVGA